MAYILKLLWALGGFISLGIFRGLTLDTEDSEEWGFWKGLVAFGNSWLMVGMFLASVVLETAEIKNLLKEKKK